MLGLTRVPEKWIVIKPRKKCGLRCQKVQQESKDTIWNNGRDKFNFWTLLDKYSRYHISSMLKFFCYLRATQRTQNVLQQPAPYRLITVHDLPPRLTSSTSVLLLRSLSWQSGFHMELFYTIHDFTLILHWRHLHIWTPLLTNGR